MLTRWTDLDSALSYMDALHRRMNQLFQEYETAREPYYGSATETWPPVNLYDAGDKLVLTAMVPGMGEKDIQISGNQEVLTLSGMREPEALEGYSMHRQERGTVRFSRSFTFPCRVDLETSTATVKNGILTVTLPKAPEAKPRQITVKAK